MPMEYFYGTENNLPALFVEIMLFSSMILMVDLLATKKKWKVSKLYWSGIIILSIIITNIISSVIVL
ncbi:hypothetical protein V7O62_09560 [Methanolobus sp. ZRKC2]|uniref:hypothetical protein n=1 Tax=Methanolobus sp. ZRKC2 TaxID=3125783 RepID=UPI003254D711